MKYSIILPVRNGSNHIKECLHSILSQSLGDFELLVLENCSTDNTVDIINSFNDHRIKLFSAGTPLTIEQNWQRAVTVQKNEFITLIGHDDVLDKDYLLVMDELIRKHPQASLYQTHFRYIDSAGKEFGKCRPMAEVQNPGEVLHNFLCKKTDVMGTGYMMRSRDYDAIGGIPAYPNLLFADLELWIELSKKSYLAVDQRECFAYRKHPSATTFTTPADIFLNALEIFVNYLQKLKNSEPVLSPEIKNCGTSLLSQYCQGLTHKVLRTPKKERTTPGVSDIINQFREYGKKIGIENYEPLDTMKIRLGRVIDESVILHSLFLLFKKIYGKPLYKK